MLRRLLVEGFKSLGRQEVQFSRLTVLFGPNAAGKSNLLDAVLALSRLATCRTVDEAIASPIRGYPIEAFAFPAGGLPQLLKRAQAALRLEADLDVPGGRYRYRVEISIQPETGKLSVTDEYLSALSVAGAPQGRPAMDLVEGQVRIRRKSKPARPRDEPIGQNHTQLSDLRFGGIEYRAIERCREELRGWRVHYLDPRVAMRSAKPLQQVEGIGVLGEDIAPFLYRLWAESRDRFDALRRALSAMIPTVEDLHVDLDEKRGTLDVAVRQAGTDYSSRILSEGTLRVLALCAIAVNPWAGSLVAFEEPENGVHPRRLELIARLLLELAQQPDRQLIVTTHSLALCEALLREAADARDVLSLQNVRAGPGGTEIRHFKVPGPLWERSELEKGLGAPAENGDLDASLIRRLLYE